MADTLDIKHRFKAYADTFSTPGPARWETAADGFFAPGADIHVCHPFNHLRGADAYGATVLQPLARAFAGLYRRDYILMGGTFEAGHWVSSTGYYAGHFAAPWLGIKPTGALAYLRFGEFHRFEADRVVESRIFFDLPELMIAAGQWPIRHSPGRDRGYTGFLPGPATQDGLRMTVSDPARSAASLAMVSDMLRGLATPDEAWRPYWHDNMAWYGPAAFGSFLGIENFAGFQVPFERAFDDWKGGASGSGRTRHFARFGDDDYVCSGGWPSLSGTQIAPFLGQPPSQKMLYMRVCDWWRRAGDKLIENWVFVDIPHVLLQIGVDLFPESAERLPA